MRTGQVGHIDVIADRRAVRGIVIVAENAQALAKPRSRLGNEGHQVHRYPLGQFADQSRRMGADRVEITQCDSINGRIGMYRIPQDILANLLRIAIG